MNVRMGPSKTSFLHKRAMFQFYEYGRTGRPEKGGTGRPSFGCFFFSDTCDTWPFVRHDKGRYWILYQWNLLQFLELFFLLAGGRFSMLFLKRMTIGSVYSLKSVGKMIQDPSFSNFQISKPAIHHCLGSTQTKRNKTSDVMSSCFSEIFPIQNHMWAESKSEGLMVICFIYLYTGWSYYSFI